MNRSSSPFPLCSWQHDNDDDEDGGDGDDDEDDEQGRDGVCHDAGGDTSSYMHSTVLQDCGCDSNDYGDNNDDNGDDDHLIFFCMCTLLYSRIVIWCFVLT